MPAVSGRFDDTDCLRGCFIPRVHMPIPTLLKQHTEDASTKWWQRCGAVRQLDTRIEWLAELDELIAAHCDGLLEAGDAGLETVRRAHENSLKRKAADVRGDGFTLVALQVERAGQSALQACSGDMRLRGAIDDYLSWSPGEQAKQTILNWSQDTTHPMHGSAVSHLYIHGLNGGDGLHQALFKSTTGTACSVLDAIANCGRIKFSAARCALLLGSTKRAVASMRQFAAGNTPLALAACQLLSLVLPPEQFNVVLHSPDTAVAIRCVGWHGNPAHVPWLLQQMQDPNLRPLAQEAFRQIVGLSPDAATAKAQPGRSKQTSAEPETHVIAQWWATNQKNFEHGPTYLCGLVLSSENLRHLLLTARQGDRDTAALRHMLMHPAAMRFPTAAHVDLQWQRAAVMTQQRPTPQKDRP
jgi:hypothetical protein